MAWHVGVAWMGFRGVPACWWERWLQVAGRNASEAWAIVQGPGMHFGPGISVLGHDMMCRHTALEQKMRSRIALAGALAEQFFGCLLVAESAADQWLEWGLQGYVQSLVVRAVYGANEANFMRIKQREAVRPRPHLPCLTCTAPAAGSSDPRWLIACRVTLRGVSGRLLKL